MNSKVTAVDPPAFAAAKDGEEEEEDYTILDRKLTFENVAATGSKDGDIDDDDDEEEEKQEENKDNGTSIKSEANETFLSLSWSPPPPGPGVGVAVDALASPSASDSASAVASSEIGSYNDVLSLVPDDVDESVLDQLLHIDSNDDDDDKEDEEDTTEFHSIVEEEGKEKEGRAARLSLVDSKNHPHFKTSTTAATSVTTTTTTTAKDDSASTTTTSQLSCAAAATENEEEEEQEPMTTMTDKEKGWWHKKKYDAALALVILVLMVLLPRFLLIRKKPVISRKPVYKQPQKNIHDNVIMAATTTRTTAITNGDDEIDSSSSSSFESSMTTMTKVETIQAEDTDDDDPEQFLLEEKGAAAVNALSFNTTSSWEEVIITAMETDPFDDSVKEKKVKERSDLMVLTKKRPVVTRTAKMTTTTIPPETLWQGASCGICSSFPFWILVLPITFAVFISKSSIKECRSLHHKNQVSVAKPTLKQERRQKSTDRNGLATTASSFEKKKLMISGRLERTGRRSGLCANHRFCFDPKNYERLTSADLKLVLWEAFDRSLPSHYCSKANLIALVGKEYSEALYRLNMHDLQNYLRSNGLYFTAKMRKSQLIQIAVEAGF